LRPTQIEIGIFR